MGFFVRRCGPSPPGFYDVVVGVAGEVSKMGRGRLVELYSSLSTRSVRVEYLAPGRFAVYYDDVYESVRRSYLAPSMFNEYRSCARRLAIEVSELATKGRVAVSVDGLRSILRGILVHRAYYECFAVGSTEVPVSSDRERIYGVVDELREFQSTLQVFEVKSGFSPDLVGAGLQVMAYMVVLSDVKGVPISSIEGYVVTPRDTYRVSFDEAVFREYRRRVEKVVEIALSGDASRLPPRLPGGGGCRSCPYRGPCLSLPDRYRSYGRFFEEHGFETLRPKRVPRSLDSYGRPGVQL